LRKQLKALEDAKKTKTYNNVDCLTPENIYTTHGAQLALQCLIHTEITQVQQAKFKDSNAGFDDALLGS
jgi:hypothetical protein